MLMYGRMAREFVRESVKVTATWGGGGLVI